MGSIGRYIFRTTFGAFLLVLVSLTGAIWMTQALRDIDLMTNQGQTVLVFIGITSLIIPQLVLVIAPVALVRRGRAHPAQARDRFRDHRHERRRHAAVAAAAAVHGRHDRRVGAARRHQRLFRAGKPAHAAPLADRGAHRPGQQHRAARPLHRHRAGLAFNIRERRPNGLLVGLLLDDRRDPQQRVTILAERGEILKNDQGNFLILENGSIQRHEVKQRDPNIVLFDRYAFDLSQFAGGPQVIKYSVRERYLWQLMRPDPNDPQYKEQPGQFRAELHDRLLAPIYPFAFVLIAFAFLGAPRTTRQSPAWSIAAVILAVSALRLIGFASTVFTLKYPLAVLVQYCRGGRHDRGVSLCDLARADHRAAGLPHHRERPHPGMGRAPRRRDRGSRAMTGTLARYFGMRFLTTLVAVLLGVFALVILIDYVEMMRRLSDAPNVSALKVAQTSLFRVPQITERILPFCMLIGAMSCYLGLSRRLELVVSRAAGMSAWQFIAPARVRGARRRHRRHHGLQSDRRGASGEIQAARGGDFRQQPDRAFRPPSMASGSRQRSDNGQSIINAASSREQGVVLSNVTAFVFDQNNKFVERIERRLGHACSRAIGSSTTPASMRRARRRANASPIASPPTSPPNRCAKPSRPPRRCRSGSFPYFIDMAERAGLRRDRLSPAIPEAAGAAVHARRDGVARRGIQPALRPLRRRAENGAGRHRVGLPALRHVEADRRSEQRRTHSADRRRMDAGWRSAR